jgi:hypothetical protein
MRGPANLVKVGVTLSLKGGLCYDNGLFSLYSLSSSSLHHLTLHVTLGHVILTMTHRLKAFTLDAGL